MRERCAGVQADSARVITPQWPSDRTRSPWTPVRMAADPSAPVTCLSTARASTSVPPPLLPVPVACLESGSTTLPSARQRASILGSWAVVDKATALGESESGTLVPARACAAGADGPQQGVLSDGASFVPAPEAPRASRCQVVLVGAHASNAHRAHVASIRPQYDTMVSGSVIHKYVALVVGLGPEAGSPGRTTRGQPPFRSPIALSGAPGVAPSTGWPVGPSAEHLVDLKSQSTSMKSQSTSKKKNLTT